ncbi:hypothetical protein EPO15_08745 [bacterium]|nr:MAG: hypothetical protein EPO15_08745 [bacterium]
MKRLWTTCVAVLLAAGWAAAEPSGPGVGVVLGDPTGGTFRYFLSRTRSFDLGVGFSGDAALWADHSWHSWDMMPKPQSGEFDLWASAGLRLETAPDPEFGVRTLLGLSYWLPANPIELFATAGPAFQLTPDGDVGVDGGVGVRFYFGGKGGS